MIKSGRPSSSSGLLGEGLSLPPGCFFDHGEGALPFDSDMRAISAEDDGKIFDYGGVAVEMEARVAARGKHARLERKASRTGLEGKSRHMGAACRSDKKAERVPGKPLDHHLPLRVMGPGKMDPSPRIPDRSGIGNAGADSRGVQGEDPGNMRQVEAHRILPEKRGEALVGRQSRRRGEDDRRGGRQKKERGIQ